MGFSTSTPMNLRSWSMIFLEEVRALQVQVICNPYDSQIYGSRKIRRGLRKVFVVFGQFHLICNWKARILSPIQLLNSDDACIIFDPEHLHSCTLLIEPRFSCSPAVTHSQASCKPSSWHLDFHCNNNLDKSLLERYMIVFSQKQIKNPETGVYGLFFGHTRGSHGQV